MKRKIIKVGNSLGVIIPSSYLEDIGASYKDEVEMEFDSDTKTITIRNKETTLNGNYLEQVVKSVVEKCLNERGL